MKVNFKSSKAFLERVSKIFKEQKQIIRKHLPDADVQHIGSTAISRSITKGDLDINVRVPEEDFKKAVEILKKFYQINQPENWNNSFASFKDNGLGFDFGVQLTVVDSKYDDFVKLRDVLNKSPELVREYNKMKQTYEGKSMDEYRKKKADFFQKLRELL